MSQSFPPSEQPESAPEPVSGARKGLVRFVPRRTGARWAALGAAVVVVAAAAGAVGVAVADNDRDRAFGGPRAARFDHEGGERRALKGPGEPRTGERLAGKERTGPHREGPAGGAARGIVPKGAPAPLPSLAIAAAAEKAAGAVSGGKVESLRVVPQDGGGSAWLAVVLGPDGVRHAVTVSGTDGAITGNTTVGGR
ncbi:hypothetical protein [Streptomyces sp. NPDC058674]|uniref:hypothetical protein n=1 Tax=Streptomyces sp. NPDC058674 TaxID=3346592 RepID=UPI0036478877